MPTEGPLQALIFDVGGVIVPHDNEMLYARLANRCSVADALERVRSQSGKTGVGSGAISVQDLAELFTDQVALETLLQTRGVRWARQTEETTA